MSKVGWVALLLLGSLAEAQEPARFLDKDVPAWQSQLGSQDPQDRHEAVWALAQLGQPAMYELGVAAGHVDPVVRYWAVQGLGKIALKRDVARANFRRVVEQLSESLTDKSAAPRIAAAEQLARFDSLDIALPVLIAALDDPQESAAMQAAAALVAFGKQAAPARSKLQQAEKSGGEYVKRLATRALQNLEE